MTSQDVVITLMVGGSFMLIAHFLDVGQGDCTVLDFSNDKFALIDCNIDGANENVVNYLKDLGCSKLECVVITHGHSDHMSGLKDLIKEFEIAEIWDSGFKDDTDDYKDYNKLLEKLKKKGTKVLNPSAGEVLTICESPVEVFSPYSLYESTSNENSIVFKLMYGNMAILFGADCEIPRWEEIYKYFSGKLKSDMLHASHHGSDDGCHEDSVKAIHPQITIIPVGEDNEYGHPGKKALKIYKENSDVIYRTDIDHTVVIKTEGFEILDENIRLASSLLSKQSARNVRRVQSNGAVVTSAILGTSVAVKDHRFHGD